MGLGSGLRVSSKDAVTRSCIFMHIIFVSIVSIDVIGSVKG